jgi:uroporphyrin-III C-methyltransferase
VSGKVYFIGAGPGDPELLTRKAWKILSAAEIVLHDALVAPEIARLAPAGAIIRNVGKRCGRKSIAQEELHALMIGYASAGQTVIRLQGGDPLIFGRAGEEIARLQEAGIDFEIIPGVTAASAAAAAAQISLTHRKLASKVVFLSAHRHAGEVGDDWESVPASGATLAIYMPGSNYEEIARNLRAAGVAAKTPCVIVSQASTDRQRIIRTDLASLGQALEVPAPALLIVGEVTRAETQELVAAAMPGTSGAKKGSPG